MTKLRVGTFALNLPLALVLALSACGGGAASGEGSASPTASTLAKGDVVQTAEASGSFKTLTTAIRAAELEGTLKGGGPFTVFAPTDEAFAKLPQGTVSDLLKPENKEKLKALLTYHVVPGRILSKEVATMSTAKSVQGGELSIQADSGGVKVEGVNVVKPDIEATNGVIHVVDAVILPK